MTEDRGNRTAAPGGSGAPNQGRRPPKEEQLDASEEVTEPAPGVLRMQLPIHFTGLGHVNMYGLVDDDGIAVVDPGMPGRRSARAVVAALRRAGYRPRDVHTIVVTHSHPDHFGGAAHLARATGAEVVTHATFRAPGQPPSTPDVASLDDDLSPVTGPDGDDPDAPEMVVRDPWTLQVPWRAPGDAVPPPELPRSLPRPLQGLARRLGRRYLQAPRTTRPLTDGAPIRLAGRDWFAVHTPGHTADHLCLHDPENRLLLAGDHVLPTITPHISGLGCGRDPLRQYLAALQAVARLDVDLALPAHGNPFTGLAERTRQIGEHHDRRLERLREISAAEGPSTVEAFSRALFPPAQWGLMAESEVFAHLEHLRLDGSARAWRHDGALVYDLCDPGPS